MRDFTCVKCGSAFQRNHVTNEDKPYCSKACYDLARQKRVLLTCEQCEKAFEVIASRLTYGRGKHCSPECQYAAIKARDRTRVKLICVGCGNLFRFYSSKQRVSVSAGKYCSRACRDENRIGEKHPQYLGGPGDDRGSNWQAQRRKALKRDSFTCQHCKGEGVLVHHIKPFRWFGIEHFKEANHLSNLLTLCEACHRTADAEIQRKERESA